MKYPIAACALLASLLLQFPVFGAESATTTDTAMQRMQDMQDMMQQIRAEPDMTKRQELMKAHMETMHSNMMTRQQEDAASPEVGMEEKLAHMEQRMQMMEMMMGQMMQHESMELENPAHDHEP
jgi:periplasmic protein CpxP/Spy